MIMPGTRSPISDRHDRSVNRSTGVPHHTTDRRTRQHTRATTRNRNASQQATPRGSSSYLIVDQRRLQRLNT